MKPTKGITLRPDGKFQARVMVAGERRIATFDKLTDAKVWAADERRKMRAGEPMSAVNGQTVREAGEAFVRGALDGIIRRAGGAEYKPASIRSYEAALRLHVYPALGDRKLANLRVPDLQRFVDALNAAGQAPSTIGTVIQPLRVIYGWAMHRGEVEYNPTSGLRLPTATRNGHDIRIAPPRERDALLDALPVEDRPPWAMAMHAGLRRGELIALRREDVDLNAGLIHVRRGWDQVAGEIAPKSVQGYRTVGISAKLRPYLEDALRSHDGPRVFGHGDRPLYCQSLLVRAKEAWSAAGLDPITLHECRHTFASTMIAAGVREKPLSTIMGHANIAITLDRYGHLFPGAEADATALQDAYNAAA